MIRKAKLEDSNDLARLSGELGYPVTRDALEARLKKVLGNNRHALFVAKDKMCGVVGWIHLLMYELLVVDRRALVGGLVVDESFRFKGIGRQLMKKSESWAREHGCKAIAVKSSAKRIESHSFYEKLGFHLVTTQHSYLLDLECSEL